MRKLRVGDKVRWRGNWGTGGSMVVEVVSIEHVESGEKFGENVEEIDWDKVADEIVVTLDNGHWAYGYQLRPVLNPPQHEDPEYPLADWQYEVANGDTRLGYEEWVEVKREQEADNE
jgi:hypothetical protein